MTSQLGPRNPIKPFLFLDELPKAFHVLVHVIEKLNLFMVVVVLR